MLRLFNTPFIETLNFNTWRLDRQSQKYNEHIYIKSAKHAKCVDAEMNLTELKTSQSISVLSFLYCVKTGGDSNDIYNFAAMWLFRHFMKDPAKAGLTLRIWTMKTHSL